MKEMMVKTGNKQPERRIECGSKARVAASLSLDEWFFEKTLFIDKNVIFKSDECYTGLFPCLVYPLEYPLLTTPDKRKESGKRFLWSSFFFPPFSVEKIKSSPLTLAIVSFLAILLLLFFS